MNVVPVLLPDEIEEDCPTPSRDHARVCQRIGVALAPLEPALVIYQQLSLDLGGWKTVLDLCLYERQEPEPDWQLDELEVKQAPAIAIEVLSPMQNMLPLVEKAREYLRHGVKSCWIVLPLARSVMILPQTGASRTISSGNVKEDFLEIDVPLETFFP